MVARYYLLVKKYLTLRWFIYYSWKICWESNNSLLLNSQLLFMGIQEGMGKTIFTIRNYSHSLGHLTPKLSLRVFEVQIEPILMYGSEVLFIGKEISDFEMVHLLFLKNMLGVKQQFVTQQSVTIYGDTGRYPLFLKQQILALKYWTRLISLPESCYLRIVYNSLASLDFIGETNWCSHFRSLLFRTNHCDVWKNHRVENANRLIKQVKLCLIIIYKAETP